MEKEKFQAMAGGLVALIADYTTCNSDLAKLQLENLIISYADNFVKIYRGEKLTAEKKSEMPCNCKHEDTAQGESFKEIIEETAERVKGTECIAVIILDKKVLGV